MGNQIAIPFLKLWTLGAEKKMVVLTMSRYHSAEVTPGTHAKIRFALGLFRFAHLPGVISVFSQSIFLMFNKFPRSSLPTDLPKTPLDILMRVL